MSEIKLTTKEEQEQYDLWSAFHNGEITI